MLTFCDTTIDSQRHESLEDGTVEFPVACYFDDLNQKSIPWHWHEELEVGIVRDGVITIRTPDGQCKLTKGDCYFLNSSVLHMIQSQDTEGCSTDSLVFHASLVGGNMDSVFWRKYVRPVTADSGITMLPFNEAGQKRANSLIQSAWLECLHSDYGFEANVRYLLTQLFVVINQKHPEISAANQKRIVQQSERIKIMLTYIKENFSENVTVQQIADSASISESECLRCFRNVLGISPIAYLKKYRLQHAAELLDATQWKISYIGQKCGFSEMSYFSKSFKEIYKRTPSEYRIRER
ncbi:AraC family transcriptional regulator [Extibacter muris]|uniref:AraC family transcriptional regulator n=1 Tax=Extibacter muris TaxID=1796622 RepID=UPI001D07B01A|nr:AraC family transcriptional regulator [Extibacter muris]MCB6202836.1 AraC family transcriptional regulator [Extibacter muris]MCQ4664154.1 AraC family transcriptional regulator [Extibacter muris]MCQ4692922.1 AraC family transcriptional regulator [Extibacter muris]